MKSYKVTERILTPFDDEYWLRTTDGKTLSMLGAFWFAINDGDTIYELMRADNTPGAYYCNGNMWVRQPKSWCGKKLPSGTDGIIFNLLLMRIMLKNKVFPTSIFATKNLRTLLMSDKLDYWQTNLKNLYFSMGVNACCGCRGDKRICITR